MIAFGQLNGGVHLLLDLIHDAAEVALGDVSADHDLALDILAVNRVRTCHGTDLGDIAQWHFLPAGIDHQVTDILHRRTAPVGGLDRQVERLAVVIDLADGFTAQHDIHIFFKLRQRDAVLRHQFAFRRDGKLRAFDLLLHFQVHQAGDALNGFLDLVADRKHQVQVRTEQLDCDIRFRTGKHGIDTVGNRLSDFDIGATDSRQLLADIVHDGVAATVFQDERSLDLGYVHA